MQISFDLISDLHVDSWPTFDWGYQATSPYCVVAGDVARDRKLLRQTLEHLGQHYLGVFYIDGNDEHRSGFENLDQSYETLEQEISHIKNVVYLRDQIVVLNGVAFVGVNSWCSFDYTSKFSVQETKNAVERHYHISPLGTMNMYMAALNDVKYLEHAVQRLQTHPDVKKIVVITHYVPDGKFIEHDPDISDCYRINASINSYIKQRVIEQDTEKKIQLWCFGHYHHQVDESINKIRFVCNPRGVTGTPWHRDPYFPVRIEI